MKTRLALAPLRSLLAATVLLATLCSTASAAPLDYLPLKLLNGWQTYGLGTGDPEGAIDENGIVHLKGAISRSMASSNVAFKLPKRLRPSRDVYITIGLINGKLGRLSLSPDGRAFVKSLDSDEDSGFTSLEGVTYPRD